jgi:hypothetical protein
VKIKLKIGSEVLTHVRTKIDFYFYFLKKLDEFSHGNPIPVLKVLNKFGSLAPLVLFSHLGLLLFFSYY